MVALVDEDHVEEVRRELRQPAVRGAGELLDVRHHEVALDAVVQVRVSAVEHRRVRAVGEIGEHARLRPEALAVRDVERVKIPLRIVRFGAITSTRPAATPKGSVAMMPGLPAADRDLDDRRRVRAAKCSRTARCASRCGSRSSSLTSMFAFADRNSRPGSCPLSSARWYCSLNGSRSDLLVVAVVAAGLADRGELALVVPTAQCLPRHAEVLGGIAHSKVLIPHRHSSTLYKASVVARVRRSFTNDRARTD